ncbi:DUF222 domain-containing protein [Nocardia stercoris]|uniref:DUF222 domain-containing protein n=1 Tax=Nocardia stercoris TaxID=2483361 RepID=A0A3M2LH43_9NOCA|nr:DUF222 domain-containing protein [Nocardia stercoris]
MFDTGELQAMSDSEVLGAIRRAHGAAAYAQAAEVLAVRELYRRRRVGSPGGGEGAAREAAAAVRVEVRWAALLIAVGVALDGLPRTRVAFTSGRIDLAQTRVIAEVARDLPRELVDDIEHTLLDAADRVDPARLREIGRRRVGELDPHGERRRRETDRGVEQGGPATPQPRGSLDPPGGYCAAFTTQSESFTSTSLPLFNTVGVATSPAAFFNAARAASA